MLNQRKEEKKTEEVAAQPEVAKRRPLDPLSVKRTPTRSNSSRIEWDCVVQPETTIDDLLNPIYWSMVSGMTFNGPNNFVNVYWDDRSQIAQLYVRYYDNSTAKMELLYHKVFGDPITAQAKERYNVEWSGPYTKFRIVRLEDGMVIKDSLPSKDDAYEFLKANADVFK